MWEFNDQRDFVSVVRKIRARCEQKKARVVFTAILQMFAKNNSAMLLCRTFSGDSRTRFLTLLQNPRHTPCGVFGGNSLQLRISCQKTSALIECDRMRFDSCNLLKCGARTADQTLIDRDNDFADDEQFAIQKQVKAGMYETGEAVLYRSEDVVGSFVADGAEKRLESRTRYKCNVITKQTNGGLFTERPRCALKCDPRATIVPFEC